MIKKLALSICIILCFSHARAQSVPDSMAKKPTTKPTTLLTDPAIKGISKLDSTIKQMAIKLPDTTVKNLSGKTDTATQQPIVKISTPVKIDTNKSSPVKAITDSTTKNLSVKTDTAATPKTIKVTETVKIFAPPLPDSVKHSPVETLTYKQYQALLKGEDLYNMSSAATLNHFPMPDKVIKYRYQLDLGPLQISRITAIAVELHRKRVEMGGIIIKNEQILDDLFKNNKADEGSIIFYTNRYGLYQGELRNAILMACYNTERLLSPAQIKQLETLENHK